MANKVSVDLDMNVQGYVQGIDQASQSTEKYETDLRKIKDSTGNFRKEFSAAKKDVLNLAQAYSKLDSEARKSAFGKEMAKQLQEAKEKAAEMTDMMGDINQELKNMASDTRLLDTMTEGMSVFMNATSAASGVIAQFTGDENAAKEAVVMFTTAQSTLNTLTAISTALQKQSNTMLAVKKVQELAAAAAIKIRTAAEAKGVATTKAATAAQKAFNIVANANPYVLLATAIIGVGTALYMFASKMSKAREEEERQKKAAEEAKKALERQGQVMAQAADQYMESAIKIKTLKDAYASTNNELQKTEILKQATTEFKKLGMSINGVSDAQKALVQKGDDVIKLLNMQAEAAAIAAIKMDLFKEKFNAIMKSGNNTVGEAYSRAQYMLKDQFDELTKKEIQLRAEIAKSSKSLGIKSSSSTTTKTTTKTKVEYEKGSLEDYKKQLSDLQNKLSKKKLSLVDIDKTKKDIEKLKKIIEEKEIELGFKERDPKTIQGTEAWWDEEIKKLENKKARLPIDAYVEREKLQAQIDNMHLKVKLETEGITVTGSAGVGKALTGTYDKTIKGVQDAISELEKKMQGDVGENGELLNAEQFDKYANKVVELKQELEGLQKTFDDSVLTPIERAKKRFDEFSEKADETGKTIQTFSSMANSMGSIFSSVGDDMAATAMQITGAVLDMAAQVIPQILKMIAAKEAQAMASGMAGAAEVPYPGSIAAIASIVATVLATIATIASTLNSVPGHADGGIVGGGSYSGDKVLARLNSGEMVLNQRQQANLFSMLDQGLMPQHGGTNVTVTGVIRGTDIMLVQKNTNKVLSKAGSRINF